jgi:hypothetical protein
LDACVTIQASWACVLKLAHGIDACATHRPFGDAVQGSLAQAVAGKHRDVDGVGACREFQHRQAGVGDGIQADPPIMQLIGDAAFSQQRNDRCHVIREQVQADGGMLIGGSFQHGTHQSRFKLVEETHRFLRSGTQAGQDGRLGLRLEQALVFAQGRFDFSVARQINIWRKPQPRGRLEFRRVIVAHALVGNQARGFNRNASSGVAMSAPRRMVHQNTS